MLHLQRTLNSSKWVPRQLLQDTLTEDSELIQMGTKTAAPRYSVLLADLTIKAYCYIHRVCCS